MLKNYILCLVLALIIGCDKKDPVEPLEKTGYPHSYTNVSDPTSTPIEKPNVKDEFYDAPKL